MTSQYLVDPGGPAIPIQPIAKEELPTWRARAGAIAQRWIEATSFDAAPGKSLLVPGRNGELESVLLGVSEPTPWDWAALPLELPRGTYRIEGYHSPKEADAAALGWALGTYRFERMRSKKEAAPPSLEWPEACNRPRVTAMAEATALVRDLINTPASDLGPAELAGAAEQLANDNEASFHVIVGDDLLEKNYPAIHAVGRAAAPSRAPRLIELSWGEASHPKVTLVGKGVCFDSGGLDLKPATNMKLMKKDMGGAAHVLGVAAMVMGAKLPLRLRVLIPAVENAVSGSAMRPLDVVPTRKGLTIEIGNTDAEGRVILADALAEASGESPSLLIDFATLTGAARVALGAELPAMFANDDELASALLACATGESDPLWRMPLFEPYRKLIDSKVADITNAPEAPLGGAITAALFLREFVGDGIPWAHIDLMAWNQSSRPGRPEGGEAMGLRAVYALLEERFKK
ncbi:MAG TPA: leucyl aminopeptidase family protein [Vicinamibacteria bacterium]|nr:leucyl aminopeptidase family protein [Vicinamibacteria bacterium]